MIFKIYEFDQVGSTYLSWERVSRHHTRLSASPCLGIVLQQDILEPSHASVVTRCVILSLSDMWMTCQGVFFYFWFSKTKNSDQRMILVIEKNVYETWQNIFARRRTRLALVNRLLGGWLLLWVLKMGEVKLRISSSHYPFTAVFLSVKVSALFGISMLGAADVNSLLAADCLVSVPLLRYDDLLIVWGWLESWEVSPTSTRR